MNDELKKLKKEYSLLEEKYKIPGFREINEDFEIDKIDKESDCLLRVIRKIMMEKIVNSMGFVEMLLNPVNAPRIYMAYLRSLTVQDKQLLEKIYGSLADLSLASLELEVEYSEKREAELIKLIHNTWNRIRSDFKVVLSDIKKPNSVVKKDKSYFG